VGLFVGLGLLLLAVLLIQFSKATTFFRPTYDLFLNVANVGGLKPQAWVLMSGVQVGSVSSIRLSNEGTNVVIDLRIYREFKIRKGSQMIIETSGFLGDHYVAIVVTNINTDVYKNLDVIRGEAPFNMQELTRSASSFLRRIDDTVVRLNAAIVDIRTHVLNEQTLTNLSTAIVNIRGFTERVGSAVDNLSSLIDSNRPALTQSSSNLVYFTDQINELAGSLRGVVATNEPTIDTAVKNLETSTETLKDLLSDVRAGKGLVGTVLKDDQLAQDITKIADNLSITTSNLNRLGLWGIMWQRKPPKK
jgi:phospholipid/cholesterol/gamma-HCH transport system substrate-binding protein